MNRKWSGLTGSAELLSLFDMLIQYAEFFTTCACGFDLLRGKFNEKPDAPISDSDLDKLVAHSEFTRDLSDLLAMDGTKRLSDDLARHARYIRVGRDLAARIEAIQSLIKDELSRRKFFYVPAERVAFYGKNDLFGPLVFRKIPKARENIQEAGTCLALDRPTACIAHLMHAVSAGMEVVAKNLSVRYNQPMGILDWKSVIQPIQKKIEDWQEHAKSQKKYDALEQYSKIATHFDYFKNAWRNKVAHAATLYDIHEAKSVMSRTETLLQEIAAAKPYKP
ncbi:MAG: hypothetical protein ACREIF_08200 [Chthoniobacterales bacterium]